MTDFRALCQELMDAIDSGISTERIKQSPLAVRVDSALAQPEPQTSKKELTDEQLIAAAEQAGLCYPVCWDLRGTDAPQLRYLRGFASVIAAELEYLAAEQPHPRRRATDYAA